MVEIEDIQDRGSLEAWLHQVTEVKGEDEGRRIQGIIAHRSAVRVMPIFWRWTQTSKIARIRRMTAMPILRACLISGPAGKWPYSEISAIGVAAGLGASDAADVAGASHGTSAVAAAAVAASEAAFGAAVEAVDAAHSAVFATDIWIEVRRDAVDAVGSKSEVKPLWFAENSMAEVWEKVKFATQSAPEGPTYWSFWRRWYEDALIGGAPRNPELLRAIALIDPEDWDKGPGFINDVKIPELQAEHARHIASTAAEITRDEATGAFTEVAVSDLEDGLFRDARDRADEAITDFRTYIDRPQSPYRAFEDDLDVIEAQLARTADRPIRCYENLADAMLKILDMARHNGLEKDSRVTTLVREFERSRRDLRADDDKIAAREAKRIRIGYDELMDAEQDDFRAMLTEFSHKSDDMLEAEMVEDSEAIASAETLPEVRDRALLRSSERMVQMDGIERDEAAKAKPSLEDVGKKADAVNKVAKAGETGAKLMAKIVEWFLTGGSV